jgi:hypothetical protein
MLTLVLVATLLISVPISATEITIKGKINHMYQIVTDVGEIYELADNELAVEVLEYVGHTVKVTGTLVESDNNKKTILVSEYEIIEEG